MKKKWDDEVEEGGEGFQFINEITNYDSDDLLLTQRRHYEISIKLLRIKITFIFFTSILCSFIIFFVLI